MATGSVFKMCSKISSFAAWGWHRACLNPLMKNTSLFEIKEFDMFLLHWYFTTFYSSNRNLEVYMFLATTFPFKT